MAKVTLPISGKIPEKVYVFSTLTCDNKYIEWQDTSNDLKVKARELLIKGGTGVANDRIVTPLGVVTEISGKDLEWVQHNKGFKQHYDAGFLAVETAAVDPEKVAADMKIGDGSAPLTDQSEELQPDAPKKDE